MLCGSCIQPKKQLKFQIIGILEEIDSFYWPKMHFFKRCQKKIEQPPPPSIHSGNARKNAFFSGSRHLWHAPCCEGAKVSPQAKVGTSPFLNAALRTVWTDDVGALLWWFARSRWWLFVAFDSQRWRYTTEDISIMMIHTFIGQDLNTRHNKKNLR